MPYEFSVLFKTFILIGVFSVMSKAILANENVTKSLVVHVANIDIGLPGNIMVMLYEKEGFPKDHAKALAINVIPISHNKVTTRFTSVPAEFAIKILHDEDGTGQVTKNWTRIMPAEGLGFSNGAKIRFGPPTYEAAKLKREDSHDAIKIDMIYP
jgi:uncharacterized protein (DUF2141 family)